MISQADYQSFDATSLAEEIRKGAITETEALNAAFSLYEQYHPELNAVIHVFYDRAIDAIKQGLPDGPFRGVPFALKDLICTFAGEPMTMGSRGIHWVPDYDSDLCKRYKAAGLNIFAKTNTPEYGLIITTEPKAHGAAHNPYKKGFSTGGSSGGSAAAVASGIVPMAHANDGGGSIRFPASWCGAFGLKPSRGRNPLGPERAEYWSGAIAEHAITRSVRDSAALLDATHGPDIGAPFLQKAPPSSYLEACQQEPEPSRVALSRKPLVEGEVDPDVLQCLEATASKLESLGYHIDEVEPAIETEGLWQAFFMIVAAHTAATEVEIRERFGRSAVRSLEPQTRNLAMLGRSFSAADMVTAHNHWQSIRVAMGEFMNQYDIMLCPTVPHVAVAHGVLPPGKVDELMMSLSSHLNVGRLAFKLGIVEQLALPILKTMGFTLLGNITGLPSMSMPLGLSQSGLPIGIQAYGRMAEEHRLFNLAAALEEGFLGIKEPEWLSE